MTAEPFDFSGLQEKESPDDLCFFRSMLQMAERRVLYHIAKDYYRGEGDIIDAGAFVGGSAFSFGLGLEHNVDVAEKRERIYSYDTFCAANDYYVRYLTINFFNSYQTTPESGVPLATITNGYDFEGIFRFQTAPHAEKIVVNKGFVQHFPWDPEKKIEILFIDIAKTKRTNDYCITNFFPAMIPGRTLLIQQDMYSFLGYLHLTMEYFSDHFEVVIPQFGTSRMYRYTKEIPAEKIALAVEEYMKPEVGTGLYRRIVANAPAHEKPLFHAAFAHFLLDVGEHSACRKEVDACFASYDDAKGTAYWSSVLKGKIIPALEKAGA